MIGPAAGIDGEALDAGPVELRRERRGELVGEENRRPVELAQQLARPAGAVPQVQAQPPGDVGDVVLTLAQVLVLDAREDRAELFVGAMHRPRGVHLLLAHDLFGASDQRRVVEHQDLRVEDRRELGAAGLGDARADVLQLMARLLARRLQHRDLALDPIRRNREPDRFGPQRQDDGAADGDARRHADADQAFHDSSPKPVSTR